MYHTISLVFVETLGNNGFQTEKDKSSIEFLTANCQILAVMMTRPKILLAAAVARLQNKSIGL